MKKTTSLRAFPAPLSALVATVLLAACANTPPAAQNVAANSTATPGSGSAATAKSAKTGDTKAAALTDNKVVPVSAPAARSINAGWLADPEHKRSVYFEYDKFEVRKEFLPFLKENAEFLAREKSTKAQIQGNGDERGSREYNLALGQKRADAVKRVLAGYGVSAERIETVSYGEEKPASGGHDEAAWAKNRRADTVLSGNP